MSYYKRLGEFAAHRYDQEVARAQQAGEQRTFYFGLLGGLLAAMVALVKDHGLVHHQGWIDCAFWTFVVLATIGCVYTFIQLVMAISPFRVGYWPLPRAMREYAEGCHAHYVGINATNKDDAVIDDIDRVIAKRVEEVTEHNHVRNNLRAARTTRCFWGLVLTGPAVLAMFVFSLVGTPAVGAQDMTNQNTPTNQQGDSQPSQSAPTEQPSAQGPAPAKPAEPQAVYIVEGTKGAQQGDIQTREGGCEKQE